MAKLGRSSRPLQGTILLALLLASTQAGLVMALDPEQAAIELGEKLVTTAISKKKGWEKAGKGLKTGFNTYKVGRKIRPDRSRQNPAGGGTPYVVDTVAIAGGTRLTVVNADITALAATRVDVLPAGFCTRMVFIRRELSVSLLGRGGTVRLGDLPGGGTLQGCSPDVAGGGVAVAVLGLGRGGEVSRNFPMFSYTVTMSAAAATATVDVSFPPTAWPRQQVANTIPLSYNPKYPNNGLYYVDITGIQVGRMKRPIQVELSIRRDGTGGVYLSTTQTHTNLERGVYGRLKEALMLQIGEQNPGATPAMPPLPDQLCYVRTQLTAQLPPMAIVFANAVMRLTDANVWYIAPGSSNICMQILPTRNFGDVSVLGSMLQSGRTMTVDLKGPGTLTF